jgi:hypothetical protein
MQRQLPGYFERRLIEARKNATRRDRFELGEDVPVLPLLLLKRAVGESAANFTTIGDLQRRVPRRKRAARRDGNEIAAVIAAIIINFRGRCRLCRPIAARDPNRSLLDRQRFPQQPNR